MVYPDKNKMFNGENYNLYQFSEYKSDLKSQAESMKKAGQIKKYRIVKAERDSGLGPGTVSGFALYTVSNWG